MSRLGLTQIPLRDTKHMWRGLHIVDTSNGSGQKTTKPVFLDVLVEGEDSGAPWQCGMEFYYANPESFYCRPLRGAGGNVGERYSVPEVAKDINIALLPPLSGLSTEEPELQPGRISVLLGEGRSGEVLRNSCMRVFESDRSAWEDVKSAVFRMFQTRLGDPIRDGARGVIELSYTESGVELDISSSGRGLQQVVLLLAHMKGNPGSVLLLDEPDAHLEVLRQREIYSVLADFAQGSGNQLIIASHSEVVMQEAMDRDVLISFVGTPRRVDDRGTHVNKALKEIRAEDYYQAERKGFVLYLEGSSDLAILRGFATLLDHPALDALTEPFVCYVANQPNRCSQHFQGLKAVKPDLKAYCLFDRLERNLPDGFSIACHMWERREIENYITSRDILLRFATTSPVDDLVSRAEALKNGEAMERAIDIVETAFRALKRNVWSKDEKSSDDILGPIFDNYYENLGLRNRMRKTDFHALVPYMRVDEVSEEIVAVLDEIWKEYSAAQRDMNSFPKVQ